MRKRSQGMILLVILSMLLSLTACGKKQTPQEVYAAAFEKQAAMTDMDMSMQIDITMTAEGESMDMTVETDAKIQNQNTEDMVMDMSMAVGMSGLTVDMQIYYSEGYYLMEIMGQKMKYPMSLEEIMEQVPASQEAPVEALGNMTMEETDGNQKITFQADVTKLTEIESYVSMLETMGMTGEEMKLESMDGSMVVNEDGCLLSMTTHIVYEMEIEGTPVAYDMNLDIVYNNPGQPVTIEVPDLSEYTEIDPSELE